MSVIRYAKRQKRKKKSRGHQLTTESTHSTRSLQKNHPTHSLTESHTQNFTLQLTPMVTSNCKPSKFNFGTLSPQFSPIRNPRNAQHLPNPCLLRRQSPRNCLAFSSEWNHSSATRYSPSEAKKKQRCREEGVAGKGEDQERKVHCEVEVVSWRERRIKAETFVHADVETVWNSLTDYERLADFVPNLVSRYSLSRSFFSFSNYVSLA